MRKWLIVLLLAVIMLPLIALAQSSSSFVRTKAVTVDGRTRTAFIWADKNGLHIQYFSDDSHGLINLGEEIFQDGIKVFDTYRENDGLRPIN